MSEKTFNTRIVHKHDTEANWLKAVNFIPKQGEIIVYDIDTTYTYERFKIGDGKTLVSALPFANDALKSALEAEIGVVDDKVDAVSALVGDTAVSEQISSAISSQEVATSAQDGLMSSEDKTLLDKFRRTDFGSMEGKTVGDLRTALEEWLDTVHDAPNSIATFRSSTFITQWNNEDTTTTLSSGATWTVELKTCFTSGTYALLEMRGYYDKQTYYVAITNNVWTKLRKVFFDSDNMIYVGPTEPTNSNIKVWINTAEEGTGVVPVLPRIATITLAAASWTGSASPYSQVVSINTVTSATKIDLQPTVSQIVSLQNDDIALMAENVDGVVTIYSFGGKPSSDMTMQVLLTEVSYV